MSEYNFYKKNAEEKNIELITTENKFEKNKLMMYNCSKHGKFESTPQLFRYTKHGCEKCSYEIRSKKYSENENNKKYNKDFFNEIFKKIDYMIHDYKIEYIDNSRKIKLICSKHGEFIRFPHQAKDTGCLKCRKDFKEVLKENKKNQKIDKRKEANKKRSMSLDEAKENIFKKFGNKYKYDFSEYETQKSYIIILCEKHGAYKTRYSDYILNIYGCRSCSNTGTSIAENQWLEKNNILERQYKIEYDTNRYYYSDGYDPITNTVYEYLGDYWHGNLSKYSDNYINIQCKKTMCELFYETENRFNVIYEMGYNITYIWESSSENKYFNGKLEI